MKQYLAGWSLKIAAIIAKIAFLSLAVTELRDGVFHSYFFLATLAVGLARFLSASGEEQIPIELRKHPNEAKNAFSSVLLFCIIAAAINFISFILVSLPLTAALSLALSVAFTALVGGAVRVNRPLLYETISNIPYILFLLLYAILRPTEPEELILHLSISFLLSSTVAFLIYHVADNSLSTLWESSLSTSFLRRLYRSWRAWIPKSISSAAVLLNLRYPIFVLLIFTTDKSDQLALALSIGEVFWQLIMIIVNRRLSFFFKNQVTPASAIVKTIQGLLFVPALAVITSISIGFALYLLQDTEWGEFFSGIDYILLTSAIFLAMTFSSFSFYRVACFYLESEKITNKPVNYLFVQTIVLIANSAIFAIYIEDMWRAMALGAILNIGAPLFFCILWIRKNIQSQRTTQTYRSSSKTE